MCVRIIFSVLINFKQSYSVLFSHCCWIILVPGYFCATWKTSISIGNYKFYPIFIRGAVYDFLFKGTIYFIIYLTFFVITSYFSPVFLCTFQYAWFKNHYLLYLLYSKVSFSNCIVTFFSFCFVSYIQYKVAMHRAFCKDSFFVYCF